MSRAYVLAMYLTLAGSGNFRFIRDKLVYAFYAGWGGKLFDGRCFVVDWASRALMLFISQTSSFPEFDRKGYTAIQS